MRKELKLSSADCRAAAAGLSATVGGVERGAGSPWHQLGRRVRGPRAAYECTRGLYYLPSRAITRPSSGPYSPE